MKVSRVAPSVTSRRFRFRFVVCGDQAAELLVLAVLSLQRCHPGAHVVVVDANDVPTIDTRLFGTALEHTVLHVRPGLDAIARAVGRATRQHLFYWRHSPELRKALPTFDGLDVHADADLLFLRPLDLAALLGPLSRGRIAAAVDESTLDHYAAVSSEAGASTGATLSGDGFGGPMWQAGLLFSNPADDGGLFDLFWQSAVETADAGGIGSLPNDDMAIFAALLGCGGPLWERALALGHDWNYITDAVKDPGVFGRVAHFGGHRAKDLLLQDTATILTLRDNRRLAAWGTIYRNTIIEPCGARPLRRLWTLPAPDSRPDGPQLPVPFCLTWPAPTGAQAVRVTAELVVPDDGGGGASVTVLVGVDGRQAGQWVTCDGRVSATVTTAGAETVTVIAVGDRPGLILRLSEPRPAEAGSTV